MAYDAIIVGGGIVGMATAYQLLLQQPSLHLAVIEKESGPAQHQTGHNSGVIHSGIYYKPGSLKAQNCLRGYRMLIDFCEAEALPYERCGKVIVATQPDELPRLQHLFERGQANGLEDLQVLGPEQLREREPHATGLQALYVPQTGIVNYKQVTERLAQRVEARGGQLHFGQAVEKIAAGNDPIVLETDRQSFHSQLVINCAGLYSDKLARQTHPRLDVRIIPFRGEYYRLREGRQHLVRHLIYPVPDPAFPFLGVHFTRMIEGGVEAGPNAVLAFRREGYHRTDWQLHELGESLAWPGFRQVMRKYWRTGLGEIYRSFSKSAFTRALQRLVPEVREEDLEAVPAGVRAQACQRDGGLLDDFLILEAPGVVNVCNAPSPAATSSLSIGQTIAEMALRQQVTGKA
jgi:L-2-hydroxyglutarate oxidase